MSDLHSTTPDRPLRGNAIDHTGAVFGRLTTIKRIPGKNSRYLCSCTCGNSKVVPYGDLKRGSTKSCGCLLAEATSARRTTHGMRNTSENKCWSGMWQRCTNPSNPSYPKYKDRAPPEEWRDFAVFYAHIGPKPGPEYSIDRIDNEKPYGPGNVRWATRKEQNNNQVSNRKITFAGKTQNLTQWAIELGFNRGTLTYRIDKLGWTIERALTTPIKHNYAPVKYRSCSS